MDYKQESVQHEAIVAYSPYKSGICLFLLLLLLRIIIIIIIIIIIKIPIIRRKKKHPHFNK